MARFGPWSPFGGYTDNAYLWVAMLLGVFWLGMAGSGFKTLGDRRWAWRLFVFPFIDIAALSLMMAVDPATF